MMRLPRFTYLAPQSLKEAVTLLRECGTTAAVVAGGTDLYPSMKRGQVGPEVVVSIGKVRELYGISGDPAQGLIIGAMTPLAHVAAHPDIRRHYPALAVAASSVGSPQIRNVGTLGGNLCLDTRCSYYNQSYAWRRALGFCMKTGGEVCLVARGSRRCWAVSSSDTAPALCSLKAMLRLVGPEGERTVPVAQLYRDDGIHYLTKRPDEILAEIALPPADGRRSAYLKLRARGSIDFPALGVAVAARMDMDRVREAWIVLGAIGSAPREMKEAAAVLKGRRLRGRAIAQAAEAAARLSRPLENVDLTAWYRKRLTRVLVARALYRLARPSTSTSAVDPINW